MIVTDDEGALGTAGRTITVPEPDFTLELLSKDRVPTSEVVLKPGQNVIVRAKVHLLRGSSGCVTYSHQMVPEDKELTFQKPAPTTQCAEEVSLLVKTSKQAGNFERAARIRRPR